MGDESQKRKKPERFYLNGRSAVAGGVFKSPMAENYFQLRQKWVQGRKKELLDLKEIDDTEFLCVVENRSDIFDIRSGDKEFKNVLIEGADLSGVDLTGLQLTNAIIRGVSFVGTKLDGSNLEGCIFIDCDWRGASLVGSNLGDCWFETSGGTLLLSEINFDQSTFEGTVFVAGIPECSFRHANLKGLWLRL
ncbi:MAG: pentapeptide repeat-containing protein, partial [Chloroflexota bacterium]